MANLLWLQGGACSGNTMPFLNAEEPSACDLVTDFGIRVLWHPSLGMELGAELQAMLRALFAAARANATTTITTGTTVTNTSTPTAPVTATATTITTTTTRTRSSTSKPASSPRTTPPPSATGPGFAERSILALNLVSAPGAGKTTLLERTIRDLKDEIPISVLEGDQATALDGDRIRAAGAPAVQINTGTGCHLDADMVARGLAELQPPPRSLVLIENVGNLVCPALFDLGERAKTAILSVTEGDDKPLKYPHMFAAAQLMVVNKIDLLAHVDFNADRAVAHARAVNPAIEVLWLSARSGKGLAGWYDWPRRAAGRAGNAWR